MSGLNFFNLKSLGLSFLVVVFGFSLLVSQRPEVEAARLKRKVVTLELFLMKSSGETLLKTQLLEYPYKFSFPGLRAGHYHLHFKGPVADLTDQPDRYFVIKEAGGKGVLKEKDAVILPVEDFKDDEDDQENEEDEGDEEEENEDGELEEPDYTIQPVTDPVKDEEDDLIEFDYGILPVKEPVKDKPPPVTIPEKPPAKKPPAKKPPARRQPVKKKLPARERSGQPVESKESEEVAELSDPQRREEVSNIIGVVVGENDLDKLVEGDRAQKIKVLDQVLEFRKSVVNSNFFSGETGFSNDAGQATEVNEVGDSSLITTDLFLNKQEQAVATIFDFSPVVAEVLNYTSLDQAAATDSEQVEIGGHSFAIKTEADRQLATKLADQTLILDQLDLEVTDLVSGSFDDLTNIFVDSFVNFFSF